VRAPTLAEWQTAGVTGLPRGVAVSSVRNEPAKEAGITVGDLITRVGGTRVVSVAHFRALVRAMRPESVVELEIVQDGDALPTWAEAAGVGSTERGGAFIAGEVLLPNGEPAAGAMVCAKINYDSGWDEQHPPNLTDSRGRVVSVNSRRDRAGRCCLLAWRYDGHAGQAVVDFPMRRSAEIRLRKVSPIAGRLMTDNGDGVANVLIKLTELRAPGVEGEFEPWDEARTGEDGRFALPPLPAGSKVVLEFTVPGYAPSPTEPYDLAQLKQGIILGKGGIAREAHIAGVVVAADSKAPLGPLTLTVEGLRQKIKVDVDGRFKAASLPPGRLTLTSQERREAVKLGYMVMPTHVDLSEGEQLTDLRIKAQPCGVVAGTVKDGNGLRIPGIKVGYYCRSLRVAWVETTAADGSYRLVAPPGVVQVRVEHGEWMVMPNMHTLRVESGKTHSADFVVRRTSGVTGIVVDAAGQPVEGALLSLSASPIGTRRAAREEREIRNVRPLHPKATTDADGRFALKNVDALQRASWIVQDPARHLRDGFAFRRDTPLPIRVVVETRMGSVRGRFIDTEGRPIARAWMNMYAYRSASGGSVRFSDGMMNSDGDGRFVYEQVMGNTRKYFYGSAKDGTAFKVPGFYVEAGQDVDFGDIVLRRPNGKPAPEIAADPIGSIDGNLAWDGVLRDKVIVLVSRWGPFLRYDRPLSQLAKRFEGPHFALLVLYRKDLPDGKPNPLAAPDLRSVILARDRPTNPNGETHTTFRTFGTDWNTHDLIVCDKRGIVRNANIKPAIDPDANSPLVQEITRLLAEDAAKLPRPTPAERRYESTIPDSASKMLTGHVGVSLRLDPWRTKPGELTQIHLRLDPSPGVQVNQPRAAGTRTIPLRASFDFGDRLVPVGRAGARFDWTLPDVVDSDRVITFPAKVRPDAPERGAGVKATITFGYGHPREGWYRQTTRHFRANLYVDRE